MSTGQDQSTLIDEQLSAWLDDELPAEELALLAARLARSPEQRARAARYGLIGSTLRSGGQAGTPAAGLAAMTISARVNAALDGMSVPATPAASRPAFRLLPYAAAAGVALIAVALVPLLRPPTGPAGAGPMASAAVQRASGPVTLVPALAQSLVDGRTGTPTQPSLSPRRLTSYLVYHGQYSGMLSAKLMDSHIVNNRAYTVDLQAAGQPVVR